VEGTRAFPSLRRTMLCSSESNQRGARIVGKLRRRCVPECNPSVVVMDSSDDRKWALHRPQASGLRQFEPARQEIPSIRVIHHEGGSALGQYYSRVADWQNVRGELSIARPWAGCPGAFDPARERIGGFDPPNTSVGRRSRSDSGEKPCNRSIQATNAGLRARESQVRAAGRTTSGFSFAIVRRLRMRLLRRARHIRGIPDSWPSGTAA
jgi:hypothetical protein